MLLQQIRQSREGQNLSRQQLATRAGLSLDVVKRIERGVGSAANFAAVVQALDFHYSALGRGATVAEQVKNRRKSLGLSVRALANLAGISPVTLARIEVGKGSIGPLLKVINGLDGTARVHNNSATHGQASPTPTKPSVFCGDALLTLQGFAADTYQTCITSPPYFGHRDYGADDQLGFEDSPEEYIAKLVEVFREVRRTLRSDGTLFLNLGDTYRDKTLLGIPWRVALALQNDGWILRQDIIWSKPNPMPEPVRDRCVRSHEYVFLFSKRSRYHFNPHAIRERGKSRRAGAPTTTDTRVTHGPQSGGNTGINGFKEKMERELVEDGFILRNKRSVWEVQVTQCRDGHYATFPDALVQTCLLAASKPGDLVLDPFGGSGTTAVVAKRLGRACDLIELRASYARLSANRLGLPVHKSAPFGGPPTLEGGG